MAMQIDWIGNGICKIRINRYKASPEDFAQELFLYAEKFRDKGDNDAALETYKQILAFTPHAAGAWIHQGVISLRRGNLVDAERCFRMAIDLQPDDPLTYFNLAHVFEEGKNLDEAALQYQKAIAIAPGYADAHYNLAIVYKALDDKKKALQHYNSYLTYHSPTDKICAQIAEAEIKLLKEQIAGEQ